MSSAFQAAPRLQELRQVRSSAQSGTLAPYFTDYAPRSLGDWIQGWMGSKRAPPADTAADLPRWPDSAEALMQKLKLVIA